MGRRESLIGVSAMLAVVFLSGCALSDTRAETVTDSTSPVILSEGGRQLDTGGPGAAGQTAPEGEAAQDNTSAGQGEKPAVYMTTDISPAGIKKVYEALGRKPQGRVAVKLSTGEAGNTHYLSPDLIKDLVQSVEGTIVECNTAYGGSRASTAMHRQVAEDHGFTAITQVDIMDENGSMSIPATRGVHLKEDLVGANLANYDSMMVLSHFKGHAMGGFGGAIKNISIGVGSSEGKNLIHTAGASRTSFMGGKQDDFLESMAEAAGAVIDYMGEENMLYISVMNHLSVDCDCDGSPAEPDMHDIGILASLDPVALDQACVDLVYAAPDGASLIQRMESRNGIHTLDYAEEIGVGSQSYDLISVDEQ